MLLLRLFDFTCDIPVLSITLQAKLDYNNNSPLLLLLFLDIVIIILHNAHSYSLLIIADIVLLG